MLSTREMFARVVARDRGCNGRFVTAVLTTSVYCLPSCPARKPKRENVRFFSSEAEARAAGFRPCLRCRPDDFYRHHDPERDRVMALVTALRRDPGDFPDVGSLVASSGIRPTRLNALLHRYYHVTPSEVLHRIRTRAACRELGASTARILDIAHDVGYASLSSFNGSFRKRTGVAPRDYRSLGGSNGFMLTLPGDFLAGQAATYLGRDPESRTERIHRRQLVKALHLDGQTALLRIDLGRGTAECRVETRSRPSPSAMRSAHAIAFRLLGLPGDPAPFERKVARTPGLARLIAAQRGARIPLTSDVFEGLVWAIVGQQVNLPFAFTLRRRLIERCGEPAGDGFLAHPGPAAVARLDYTDLVRLRFSRRKAEYLIDAARLVSVGGLALEELPDLPVQDVEERLLAVRGLGVWSARYVMMRACGFADCVPSGDVGLSAALRRFFELDRRPGPGETEKLLAPFAPYRSLAAFHLWMSLKEAP